MVKQFLGKTICPICGKEFWKKSHVHKYCCVECRKIGDKENHRLQSKNKTVKYDFVLDMETWKWKKNG